MSLSSLVVFPAEKGNRLRSHCNAVSGSGLPHTKRYRHTKLQRGWRDRSIWLMKRGCESWQYGRLREILTTCVCRCPGEDGKESLVTWQEDMGTNGSLEQGIAVKHMKNYFSCWGCQQVAQRGLKSPSLRMLESQLDIALRNLSEFTLLWAVGGTRGSTEMPCYLTYSVTL